jgi:kinetochore protein NDC80
MPGRSGGSSMQSDPRPLNDKQYMVSSAKTLISFLSAHHYAKAVNMKMLSSPTAQEFYSIVEFLYRQIDGNWQLPADKKKYEEAIPQIFKSLGYPFTISRTSLSGVGTPHTWPTLLGALTWLVELITYQEQVSAVEREAASQWETINADQLFFEYTSKAYSKFLAGDDANIEALDHEMAAYFQSRNDQIGGEIHALDHKLQTLEHDEKRTLAAPTRLANVAAHRDTLASDIDKFRVLIDELEAARAAVAQREALHRAEIDSKEAAIVATRDEIQALTARLDKQELRPADVERLQSERLTLERTLLALTKEREQSEKSVADKQRAIAEHMARIDAELADYHSEARRLELIPSNAANARGRNLTVQFNHQDASTAEQTLCDDIKKNIVPALRDTLDEMRAALADDQRQLLQLSADKERLVEQLQDEGSGLDALQHRAKKCEQAYAVEKDKCNAELRTIETEIEKIQAEIDGAKDAIAHGLDAAASSVALRQAHFKQLLAQCAAEKDELARVMLSMVQLISRHRQFVVDTLDQTRAAMAQEVADATSVKIEN